MSKDCPQILKLIQTSYADLSGNTTVTRHGTVVRLWCSAGYHLTGDAVLTCDNGRWNRRIPKCEANGLTESDIAVIAACVSLVLVAILSLLIISICYQRERTKKEVLKHRPTALHFDGVRYRESAYLKYLYDRYYAVNLSEPSENSSIRWDPKRMDWHERFDYSKARSIPRPHILPLYRPHQFYYTDFTSPYREPTGHAYP